MKILSLIAALLGLVKVTPTPLIKPINYAEVPVAEWHQRITKKMFGTYVNPQNSPVKPEKFTGYHTGVDIEFTDTTSEVPVKAVADGTIRLSRFASGYGGVLAVESKICNQDYVVIYGHLRISDMKKSGEVKRGETIGFLGEGYSHDTDGERKHLHLGVVKGDKVNILGYVQKKSELNQWTDPLEIIK